MTPWTVAHQALLSMVFHWIGTCKRMKLHPYFTPYINTNSKWMKDVMITAKTIKLKRKHMAKYHFGFDMIPKSQTNKPKKKKKDKLD